MPKSSAKLTLTRHWQILQRLPSRDPGMTATELADHLSHECGLALTKRTIERDLVELTTLFPITSNTDTKPYRWRWTEGKKLELAGLDVADALSLVLAEQVITPLLPATLLQALSPRFALAHSKLTALESHQYSRWSEKVRSVPASLNLCPPRVSPDVLSLVQEALLKETQIRVAYLAPQDPKHKELTLNPLSFIQRGPVPYLSATAFDYDDVRLYALHRMSRPVLLKEPREVPVDYTTDAYIKSGALNFGAGEVIQLKATVSDELAIYLTETPLAEDQKIKASGGHYELTATVQDSWQLSFWILSQGAAITVHQPAALRLAIMDVINQARGNYITA